MMREQIIEFASQSPEFGQGIDVIEERLSRTAMVPEDLDEAIEMLEAALENPAMYAEMVQAAIADGLIDEGDAPAEFDPVFIISILLALYGLQDRGMAQGYARGGLTVAGRRLANQGQGGDSMLAHINPREAEVLRRMGGQGTVNPNTGLVEYKSLKKIFKTLLPVALTVFAPGLGTALGAEMGFASYLGAAGSQIAGSALVGAGTAALTGADPLRGAVMGGISGGVGSYAGDAVNKGLGLGLTSPTAIATLGSGLVGGAAGAISGDGFAQGALQGAGGQFLKNVAGTGSSAGPQSTLANAFQAGVDQTGNMLTAGYNPQEAVVGGATAGLFTAGQSLLSGPKPSESVVSGLKDEQTFAGRKDFSGNKDVGFDMRVAGVEPLINKTTGDTITGYYDGQAYTNGIPNTPSMYDGTNPLGENFTAGIMNSPKVAGDPYRLATAGNSPALPEPGFLANAMDYLKEDPLRTAGLGILAAGALESVPEDVGQAVSEMSPEQQEYFNRDLVSWDWDAIRADANRANLSLTEYMASNFNNVTSGQYNMQSTGGNFAGYYQGGPMRMNQGGPLSQASRYVRGGGTGRSDEIPAYLSDGEFVVDAETVSMLGDGSSKAGAAALDTMRKNIRSHKGKVLAQGQFSPNAKSPLQYLKGASNG